MYIFRYANIAHFGDHKYSVNITFICTGKPKNICYSFCCGSLNLQNLWSVSKLYIFLSILMNGEMLNMKGPSVILSGISR